MQSVQHSHQLVTVAVSPCVPSVNLSVSLWPSVCQAGGGGRHGAREVRGPYLGGLPGARLQARRQGAVWPGRHRGHLQDPQVGTRAEPFGEIIELRLFCQILLLRFNMRFFNFFNKVPYV